MAVARPLGPGSVLGPGRLGQLYRITGSLNTTDGAFGEVFIVELEPPPPHPRTWAVKVSRGRGVGCQGEWEHEIGVMQRVRDADCPHLAAVRDHFADAATGRLCIVMERYRDSLEGVLGENRPTARVVWGWAADMARGLAVLHRPDVGIIHTDLELRNVFVDDQGRAVLGDFGTSLLVRAATSGGVRLSGAPLKLDVDSPMTPPEVRRAFVRVAPYVDLGKEDTLAEALVEGCLSPKADVWALGAILLQLLLGPDRELTPAVVEHLAGLELPARERALRDELEPIFGGPQQGGEEGVCAEQLATLIARVLTLDPSLRPPAADLLSSLNPDPEPPISLDRPQPLEGSTPRLGADHDPGVMANPDLPRVGERVVARPTLLERLKRAVLAGGGGAVAVTSTWMNRRKVWGMGGVGKTTLAKMLMDDGDVRARFRDGVAWVVLGNEVSDVVPKQRMVYRQLTGREPSETMGELDEGKQVLRRALAGKACLVVVDDVWEKPHANAFDVCGPEGMLLVTSRFDGVVSTPPEACIKVNVLEPPDGEVALAMLRSHARQEGEEADTGVAERKRQATPDEVGEEGEAMRAVLRRCGGVPLAIALAGSLKRSREATWREVLEAVDRHGGRLLDRDDPSEQGDYPHEGLWAALRASVAHLKAANRQHYECLLWYGAFMEDTWVPLEIVRRVWSMDAFEAKGVLRSLAGRSLIELDGEGQWRSQTHDLLRDFLQAEAREAVGERGVRQMHGAIVRQGMQACERAKLYEDHSEHDSYFGHAGVAQHLEASGEGKVSHAVASSLHSILLCSAEFDCNSGCVVTRLCCQVTTACIIFLDALRQPGACPALKILTIDYDQIGVGGMRALAKALRQPGACPALEGLKLSGNKIGDEGARAVADALRQPGACPALQRLQLSGNQIGDEGARALAEALRQPGACPSLQLLVLTDNEIGDEGMLALAEALRQPGACPRLQGLGLSENHIGAEGVRALAEALRQPGVCPALEQLWLDYNEFGADGARALAETLRQPGACQALQMIMIDDNLIRARGALALAEALRQPGACPALQQLYLDEAEGTLARTTLRPPAAYPTLQILTVDDNRIRARETPPVAEALGQPGACPALQRLMLSGNHIGDEGMQALAEVLRQPAFPALQILKLSGNHIGTEGARALAEALR
jgi:serine/threonine protein kinase